MKKVYKLNETEEACNCTQTTTCNCAPAMVEQSKSINEVILDYIMLLEGFKIRLRELHWVTKRKSEHLLTDELIDKLNSYEDTIAEDFMGLIHYRIQVGSINPIMPKETLTGEVIAAIKRDTLTLRASLDDCEGCAGLCSTIDEFIHNMNVYDYLNDMV